MLKHLAVLEVLTIMSLVVPTQTGHKPVRLVTDLVLSVPQVNLPSGVLVFLLRIISSLSQDHYSGYHSGQRSPS